MGYKDEHYFSRVFKKIGRRCTGQLP
ncbi:hypothetical protein ACFTAO_04375 [Paenibacillus rhizoplanae]